MPAVLAAVDLGLVGAVGVCNFDSNKLREFHGLMAARSIQVVSNQVSPTSAAYMWTVTPLKRH